MTQGKYSLNHTPRRQPLPSDLAHDLRTPVNHIIGFTEILMEHAQEAGKESFMPDLQRVQTAGRELLSLLDDRSSVSDEEPISEDLPTRERPELLEERGALQGSLLVVDDNEGNREVLSRRLEASGYVVSAAENGRQALEMLATGAFDLVLLDIMMPEMDGYEVLRTLKADGRLRHIPVIMISALSELESVARCIEMGAEDYLPKPFNPTLLKARISACLEKKRGHDRETRLFDRVQQSYVRLQELEKLRDDLTHMIVHDLRRPLNSLISGMQSLETVGELNSDQRQLMGIAVDDGEALLAIVNNLLEVEKLESGSMQLDWVMLAVSELVASAVRSLGPLAQSKQLKLVREIPDDVPYLEGDEIILRRVIANLLSDAIEAAPVGGSVTLEAHASKDGQSIEFSIGDTGERISPEAFGEVLENSSRDIEPQAGLGLTFCKLAIEAHGGRIAVVAAPNEGRAFYFTIRRRSPSERNSGPQEAITLL